MTFFKTSSALLLVSSVLFGQYQVSPATAAPAGLPAALGGFLEKQGIKITAGDKVFAELWFRATPPPAANQQEDSATWTGVAHGSLIGVIHFPANHQDRRGQVVKAGTYTLRLSFYPQNGDHQGVAPQRDFLLLTPVADDPDPSTTPKYEVLTAMSKKSTGTPHPGVLSMWKVDSDFKAGFEKMGESDYVLQVKVGGTPIAIILIGKAEG